MENKGGNAMCSRIARRPSPSLDVVRRLPPKPRKRKRRSPYEESYDEQPIPETLEPQDFELRVSQDSKSRVPQDNLNLAFRYKPMEESRQDVVDSLPSSNEDAWIRLLKIFPSKSGKRHYELITIQFYNHPPYKAISYAWGDPAYSQRITVVQGQRKGWIKVPVNLHAALDALRNETEDVLVWADSVCINQQDNSEKNQQLSRIPAIYGKAEQVIVWLGVEMDDSKRAQELLYDIAHAKLQISSKLELNSVVSLFDRDYWSRLWVVQEILHANDIVVRCGSSWLPWDHYTQASGIFQSEKASLTKISALFHGRSDSTRLVTSQHRLNPLQILIHHGPASISHIQQARELHSGDPFFYFLHVLRLSRTKLASDPKDRLYGILGILPEEVRATLKVDYQLTVKQIYINVVEVLLESGHLDVICESIHFPPQISNANLPSWVPDWSYDPMTRSLASLPLSFSAGDRETPSYRFYEGDLAIPTRSKLLVSGVRIGTIKMHGMTVNTHSRAADYCMAFLQWRVLLLQRFGINHGSPEDSEESRRCRVADCEHQRRFCLTLSLGQPTRTESDRAHEELIGQEQEWVRKCYGIFAKTVKSRLPLLPIDEDLMAFAKIDDDMEPDVARQFLQDRFARYMMGRCFCITNSGSLGLGSGAMAHGDVVVVPYGCSTPVLLRPEGHSSETGVGRRTQEYRFVGDAYIHGYMDGEALEQGSKEEFVLH